MQKTIFSFSLLQIFRDRAPVQAAHDVIHLPSSDRGHLDRVHFHLSPSRHVSGKNAVLRCGHAVATNLKLQQN